MGTSWGHLGLHFERFLKPRAMPTSTLTKMTKLHFRVDEAQKMKEGFETPKKPWKIDAAASSKQVNKMQPIFVAK